MAVDGRGHSRVAADDHAAELVLEVAGVAVHDAGGRVTGDPDAAATGARPFKARAPAGTSGC